MGDGTTLQFGVCTVPLWVVFRATFEIVTSDSDVQH